MRIVHLAIEPTVEPTKKGKLANNKQALRAWIAIWQREINAKLDKQKQS